MGYILSVDQSTAGTKGLIWDKKGKLLARYDVSHRQIIDENGWIEHDPKEILSNVVLAVEGAIDKAKIEKSEVEVVGISNQRETAVCWHRKTGDPLCNAIVWQCSRATELVEKWKEKGFGKEIKERTGLNISPFFSGPKWAWMIENDAQVQQALQENQLCFGTMDSWLLFCLAGVHETDYSNASRTMLLNLDTLQWDERLLELFGIPAQSMPKILNSDALFGYTDIAGVLPKAVPIYAVMGDSHASLFANGCVEPYNAKATYGTGSSIMMNIGKERPQNVSNGIVTSIAWAIEDTVTFALEGNINHAGDVIKWLVKDVELLENSSQAGGIASSIEDTQGVYLIPAFSGLGAPYFDSSVRAALLGMNRGTKKAHIVRAAEECIAYQVTDVVRTMEECTKKKLAALKVDGGPTKDDFLMQFQADSLDTEVCIGETEELSGAGVAYLAAIASKIVKKEELLIGKTSRVIYPGEKKEQVQNNYIGWKDAIRLLQQ